MRTISLKPFDKQTLINLLNQDYCLWVGAGVAKFMTSGTDHVCPDWLSLVKRMEQAAKIELPISCEGKFISRLENVLRVLGRHRFQMLVREFIVDELALGIVDLARAIPRDEYTVPK